MSLYEKIVAGEEKISLVGLGYVGMPIAVAFARKVKVVGFDLNEAKINLYKSGIDPTREVGDDVIKTTSVEFTADPAKLKEAKFHIVAVPTPVNDDHTPDLTPVEGASRLLGQNLTKGSIVVFESTVYPGVTEDICVPILEKESGLKCGVDFKIGYSPERINPGDKVHRLETITKIVSGMDEETLDEVAKVYELVVEAGVHRAESIKVAEAAKVIENSQRDINIAFMNELSIIFNKMGIDTKAVLEAAETIPMLYAANTSKLVNVMNKLLELVAKTVGEELDIEILEMHDQWKKDAPSGTSKEMGEVMARAMGKELNEIKVHGREGVSPRIPGTIGYHSLRAGNIPSSHTVFFGGMGERLEITHHSYNWECFARGACDCAAFLKDKEPGFYTIKDVLNI